jgi:hypothetical protein
MIVVKPPLRNNYRANICAQSGCQWRASQRESQELIRKLQARVLELETALDRICQIAGREWINALNARKIAR